MTYLGCRSLLHLLWGPKRDPWAGSGPVLPPVCVVTNEHAAEEVIWPHKPLFNHLQRETVEKLISKAYSCSKIRNYIAIDICSCEDL